VYPCAVEPALPQLELDNQLCFALYDASRAMTRAYGPLLAELGLTYPQYLTMLVLWGADGSLSVGDIGARLHLDSGTLTPLLKRLDELGFVERMRDPSDERRVLVSLTKAGRRLRSRAADIPARMGSCFPSAVADVGALRDELKRLTAALSAQLS
jgi:MarR family transcriptional regulator, organic hydroperoxide resistance regulator